MSHPTHHAISRLVVRGGFLDGATIEFAPGLNCLIGGRGAGKTTVLEFLRYGLGLMPDAKADGQRHKVIDGLIRTNLDDGRVVIDIVTRTGMRYTADRAYGQSVQVVNEMGTAVPVVLDRDHIFSADVFSQNQIEDIAVNPAAQLELLDRFDEKGITAIGAELAQIRVALRESAGVLVRLDDDIDELKVQAADVPVLRERILGLSIEVGPDAERLTAAHDAQAARAREAQLPDSALTVLGRLDAELRETGETFQTTVRSLVSGAVSDANDDLIAEIHSDLRSAASGVQTAFANVSTTLGKTAESIRRWKNGLVERHTQQEGEYRALLIASNEEAGRSQERSTLAQNLAQAETAEAELAAKVEQRSRLANERRAVLNRASELRDLRFGIRQKIAQELNEQFEALRVAIAQDADLGGYCDLLAEKLRDAGVKPTMTAQRLADHFVPGELAEALFRRDVEDIANRCEFDLDRARRIVDALESGGGAYEIEEIELADRPCIELKDGEQYKESASLSTGQRCTTILPILLRQSERPLLVDQPEDNLDNAFIYDTVVKALRSVRGARQIIFVTHNPNIPVLGDADRVFVFSSDGHRSRIRQAGSVDECKSEIERILEGGEEAFLERKTRYGH